MTLSGSNICLFSPLHFLVGLTIILLPKFLPSDRSWVTFFIYAFITYHCHCGHTPLSILGRETGHASVCPCSAPHLDSPVIPTWAGPSLWAKRPNKYGTEHFQFLLHWYWYFPHQYSKWRKENYFFFKEESYLVAVRRKGQIRPGQGDFLGAVTVVHSRIWTEAMKAMLGVWGGAKRGGKREKYPKKVFFRLLCWGKRTAEYEYLVSGLDN